MFKRKHPGKLQSSLTRKILQAIEYLQRRWATYMQDKASRLSPAATKRWFAAVLIAFFLANMFVLYHSLTRSPVTATTAPPSVPMPPRINPGREADPVFSATEKQAIGQARHMLDSLSSTPDGKARLEEFMSTHQGFADSLARAEQVINH